MYEAGFHDGVDQVMTTARNCITSVAACHHRGHHVWHIFFLQVMAAIEEEMADGAAEDRVPAMAAADIQVQP